MKERVQHLIKELQFFKDATDLDWSEVSDFTESSFFIDGDDDSAVTFTDSDGNEAVEYPDEISPITVLGNLVFYPSQDSGLLVFSMDNYEGDPEDVDTW